MKHGLAGWLSDINWAPVHDALKSHGGEVLSDRPFEVRVRLALTDLRTTFIKLGQMLSTRPAMVGPGLAGELDKLQRHTPPDPPEVAAKMVEAEPGLASTIPTFVGHPRLIPLPWGQTPRHSHTYVTGSRSARLTSVFTVGNSSRSLRATSASTGRSDAECPRSTAAFPAA